MKIGIYGGSFNPITTGHVAVIKACLSNFDEVWLLIDPKSHSAKSLQPDHHRRAMCAMAVAEFDKVKIYDSSESVPYSEITIWRDLKSKYPNDEFYFIMGADVANGIHTWDNYPEVLDDVHLCVVTRKGYDLSSEWRSPHMALEIDVLATSSTQYYKDMMKV